MSFLAVPIITTPLLKVPLLVSSAFFTYSGFTPPRAHPRKDERDRAVRTDINTATIPLSMCGLALTEAALIITDTFPSTLSSSLPRPAAPLGLDGLSVAGCLLATAGGALRIWCHRALGRFFTWPVALVDDHALITSGPYAYVRHPGYSGFVLIVAGSVALHASPRSLFVASGLGTSLAGRLAAAGSTAFMLTIATMLLRRMGKEDEVLRKGFGREWDQWAERTPWFVFPGLY
ncbi:ICMT-domain-containing protein [Epithele typhae]|uniref:ICMT-domain-containing protein n=1 Tax=Epithele typhae TaxID=378194 RepID=UPI002007B6AF|nr:ICMT-domain-containing protein [Epithele typhae]KAH9930469.1 ICMT-domain-containing protein [Epithele typhae]